MTRTVFGEEELWSALADTSSPILLYGTGDGADKILSVMEKRGSAGKRFFRLRRLCPRQAFPRRTRYVPFRSGRKIRRFYGHRCVSASSRDDVIENVKRIASRHRLFIADVPVCGGELFDADFYENHLFEINEARGLFSDDESKRVYDSIIKFRLSGKPEYLWECSCDEEETFSLLSGGYGAYIDLGAYTGDTVKKAISLCPSIKKVCAFEPAKKPFEKLSAFCSGTENVDFSLINACARDKTESIVIADGGGRGTHILSGSSLSGAKSRTVDCVSPDEVCNFSGEKLLIKYDVEGAERQALLGSLSLIKNNDTELAVSLYHRSGDIFSLAALVHQILPEKALYLRRLKGFPAWT